MGNVVIIGRSGTPHLTSPCCWAWAGAGGTEEPATIQEGPGAGSEVGLMYSFSSSSEGGAWPPDAVIGDLSEMLTVT